MITETFKDILKEYLKTPEDDFKKRRDLLLKLNYLQTTSEEVKIFWRHLGSFPKNPAQCVGC